MQTESTPTIAVPTFEDSATRFLEYLSSYRRCSPATIDAYRRDLRRFGDFLERGHLPQDPGRIGTQVIQAFAISIGHLAPASVNRTLNCLSSLFGFLQRQGLVERNPVRDVERPRVPLKLPVGPSLADAQRLIAAARTSRDKSMLLLMACCGLRRSEVLGLDRSDIASDLTELTVRQGKGQKDRVIPIPAQCRGVLHDYLDPHEERTGPLFVTSSGRRLGATALYRMFRRLLRRSGLEGTGLTPHSLRHLYATSLLRGRADVETVRSLLGHRDLRTTSRYLHADDQTRRAAVETLPLLTAVDLPQVDRPKEASSDE